MAEAVCDSASSIPCLVSFDSGRAAPTCRRNRSVDMVVVALDGGAFLPPGHGGAYAYLLLISSPLAIPGTMATGNARDGRKKGARKGNAAGDTEMTIVERGWCIVACGQRSTCRRRKEPKCR